MSTWKTVWVVIRREYVERVRTKAFIISTVLLPVILFLMFAVPVIIGQSGGNGADRTIVLVDRTGVLAERLTPDLVELDWTVESRPWSSGVVDSLRTMTEAGGVVGFLVLDDATLERGEATFYTRSRPAFIRNFTLSGAVTRAAMEYRLEEAGLAPSILDGGDLRVELLGGATEADAGSEEAQYIVAFMGGFVLYMVIIIYSVAVMRATLEEKTNRIVEVIVSSMKPWHLLLGKIIGVGAVGLTQMGIWVGTGVLAATLGIPTLMAARPDITGLVDLEAALPGMGLLALFSGYFLLGFFLFSGLYAAVGAMCSTSEEAQQAQGPLVLLLVVPMMIVPAVIRSGSAAWAVALSLFPPFTPILMWARVAGGGVPAWEIALSFALLALAILAAAWAAGKIYKVGILMTGKRPTLPELWRWLRAGS